MKKLKAKAIIAMIISMICVLRVTPSNAFAANKPDKRFEVGLAYGYNNVLRDDRYCPFNVTVKNNGNDFEGSVWVVLPGIDHDSYAYEQKLSLPKGSEKTVTIYGYIPNYVTELIVKITDHKEKEVYSKTEKVNFFGMYNSNISVGILSDDASAFNFLGSSVLIGYDSIGVNLIPLRDNMLTDHPKAYDYFDYIIISDYSTDRLTSFQIQALFDYVQGGGVLYIGTGATASKVLSGFREYLPIEDGVSQSFSTDFGLPRIDKDSIQFAQGFSTRGEEMVRNLFNLIDWDDFTDVSLVNEIAGVNDFDRCLYLFAKYEETIYKSCFSYYFGWELDEALIYCTDQEISSYKNDIRTYFESDIYYSLIELYNSEILSIKPESVDYSPVSSFFSGEKLGTEFLLDSQGYAVAYRYPLKNGCIFLFPFDLTSASFINYPNADKFLLYFYQQEKQEDVRRLSNSLSGGYWMYPTYYDDYAAILLSGLRESPLLPLIAYTVIFVAYLVLSFVAYFTLRKRKKSIFLWAVQGAFSIIAVLLILISSLGSRITRPVANVAEIVAAYPSERKVNKLCTITFPKNSKYTIPFAPGFFPEIVDPDHSRFILSAPNDSKVSKEFLDVPGTNSLRIKTAGALSSIFFKDESILSGAKTPAVEFNGTYDPSQRKILGTLTNNTRDRYTDCLVVTDYAVITIKELLPGQSIDLSTLNLVPTLEYYTSSSYSELRVRRLSDILFAPQQKTLPRILGFGSTSFKDETIKTNMLEYAVDNNLFTGSEMIMCSGINVRRYQPSLWNSYNMNSNTDPVEAALYSNGLGNDYFCDFKTESCFFLGFSSGSEDSLFTSDKDLDLMHTKLLILPSSQNRVLGRAENTTSIEVLDYQYFQ